MSHPDPTTHSTTHSTTDPMNDRTTDPVTVREAYLATWNAADPAERRARLAEGWHPEATYTDPMAEVRGHDAIDGLVGAVRDQFPGFVFTPVGEPDGHHGRVRFQWGLGPAGADPVVIGSDVVVLDAQGRVADVHGFLDQVPVGLA
ncbi:nuclear transport factor 2 family protein [Pedococcus ginsenosidimutans]|uniref:Nuclear transport factor 2 family protein n=1 Tax=Pedococcus ginsenosidimutans TaxID=490570 RepID=A0ABP8Y369_9MICO